MQPTRRLLQLGFLILTVVGVYVVRGNAERWCPFGGVEAIYGYLTEGNMLCSLGVSNFYMLGGVLLSVLLLRRAFCSYVCPIGTVSEWIQLGARRLGIRPRSVPPLLDRALSLLKYVVLGVILYVTWRAGELLFRGYDPCYALLSRHGEDITVWAYIISGAVLLGSLFVMVPFCRWLCPLAAVFHPFSRVGFARVRRNVEACVLCGQCARACPMQIPVDQVTTVRAARCTSCLNCVTACPTRGEGALEWGPPRRFGRAWPQAVLVVLLLACIAGAVAATYAAPLPSFTYTRQGHAEPPETATVELHINDLACRGRANLLVYYLDRDDLDEIPGYLRLEAWPGPDPARARITYDPAAADEALIRRAITEPYYDLDADFWRSSPFTIEPDPNGVAPSQRAGT